MQSDNISTCINCGEEASTQYCGLCGQPMQVPQLKWNVLLDELNQRVLGVDNRFMRTIIDCTIRPGKVVSTFISGNRMKYVSPVGYFLILLTIYITVMSITDINMLSFTQASENAAIDTDKMEGINGFIFSNFRMISLALMPLVILSIYLLFKNKGYNYIQTAVLVLYSQAHTLVLVLVMIGVHLFTGWNYGELTLYISFLYLGYVCMAFYEGNKIWNFIKGILASFLYIIIVGLLALIVTIVTLSIKPELLEAL